jgi:hypothetical protein
MTSDEIIEMARQLKMPYYYQDNTIKDLQKLEAFAKLVAQHEREACAKVCFGFEGADPLGVSLDCAAAIRARGQA